MVSQARYIKFQKEGTPTTRKIIYKERQKEIKKKIIADYKKPEKIREAIAKTVGGLLPKTLQSRAILKKAPRATYAIPSDPDYQRSSFFNQEYEKEKNIISWK